MTAALAAQRDAPPSFLKGLTLAAATVAVAMWGLGTLWLHAEQAAGHGASTGPVSDASGGLAAR